MPRGNRSRFHEASRLRSIRDSDVVPRMWQKSAGLEQNCFRLAQACEQMQRELNRLRRRGGGGGDEVTRTVAWFYGLYDGGVIPAEMEVWHTPAGGVSGTYISLLEVPAGIAPETGSPYWAKRPSPTPGAWSF